MSVEKLYQEVKSGRVKLDQLNDEGKAVLRDYMNTRKQEQGQQLVTAAKTVKNTVGKLGTKLGGQLKTAFSDAQKRGQIVQAERQKQEEERLASRNAYEKWYEDKFSKSFVGKALDKLQGADRAVSNFKSGALDTSSFGTTQAIGKASIKNIPGGEKNLQPILDQRKGSTSYKVGQIAGYVPPAAAADRLVVKLGGEALKKLPKLAQGLIRGSASGALDTTAQEGGDVAFRGGTFDPENIAIGAGAGGVIGGAAPLVKSGLNAGLKPLIRTNLRQSEALERAAALLPQSSRRGTGAVTTPDIRIRPGQPLPESTNPLSATDDIVRSATEPDFLNSSPGREPQPIRIDEDVIKFNESGIGNASSFESKISRQRGVHKRSLGDWWEKFKTQFTEDISPINKLERSIKGEIPSAEKSFYKSARLFKGTPEKINQFIDQRLKPIVRGIEKQGYHSNDLGRYALAVHARDVNAAGIKSGFTNAEIDDVIRQYGTPELEAARQQLVQINKELLDDLVDSGVVSGEMRNVLNERWKNYIPLFRDVDDVVANRTGLSEALANVSSPIKKLKGGEQNVLDPLENMITNIVKNMQSAERNRVASFIPELAGLDAEKKFIRQLADGEAVNGKNVINVKVNGENVAFEVEKDVRDAILTLNKESSAWLIRFLSEPASWLRSGATLTPEFIIRNPIRDYRNARIVSESGFRLDDYAVGLASSIMGKFGKGKLYQDWVKNLGAYGNIVSEDRKLFAAAQRKILSQSTSKKFVNIINPKNFIKLLRGISDISESSTKVGEFRAALRKGATKQEAAYRARDIMDFARAGSSIRQTNKIVAFLNANIQGKSKMVRAFKNNPVRTSVRVFRQMAVPTAGIYFYNKHFANETQKETIKNAPDWQKNTFWLVAIPGTDSVARVPKPFDFAVVANVVERSLDFFEANDKEAFDGFAQGVIADNGLPMMITGLQPLLEGAANYSFFRQGPVIPQRDFELEYKDQYDPVRTSETAKGIAKGVDTLFGRMGGNFRSPYTIDNTIQGLFAGGGKYATDAIDAILGGIGASDRPEKPEKSIEQKPVIRSLLVDPNQGGKAMEEFYSEKERLTREKNSSKRNEKTFNYDKEQRLKVLNNATKEIGEINTEIRSIERSMLLTSKQKRDQINSLIEKRMKIIKNSGS